MKIVVLIVRLLLGLVFFVFGECLSAIPQGPYTRRPRWTVSSGSIPVALWVGDRRSAGGWRRAAADQSLCSAGADDSWAGNRKYFALPSAAQSRRHRGRADREGVLVCVVLPLSPVLFRDLYRKGFVCVVTANACGFARTSGAQDAKASAMVIAQRLHPLGFTGGLQQTRTRDCLFPTAADAPVCPAIASLPSGSFKTGQTGSLLNRR